MSKTILWNAVKRAMGRYRDDSSYPLVAELDSILEEHKPYLVSRAEVSAAKEARLTAKAADKEAIRIARARAKEEKAQEAAEKEKAREARAQAAWEAGRAARFRAKWKANVPNISPPTEAEFIAMSGKTYKEFLKG